MRTTRRIVQVLFLLFFFYLFFSAAYPLTSVIPVDLFLRTDPLVAVTTMLSSRSFFVPLLWSLALVAITIPLGRVFCGWACPLGAVLDGVSFLTKNRPGRRLKNWRNLKYYLLAVILVASLFTLQLTWTLDPVTLLTRSVTLSLFPMLTLASTTLFDALFGFDFLQDPLLGLQMKLNSTLLPEQLTFFRWAAVVFLLLAAVVGLEFLSRRFWCRYLCPLGALYAVLSKFQIFQRRVSGKCTDCGLCVRDCKMDAIREDFRGTRHAECILCYNCVKDCPEEATSLAFSAKPARHRFSLTRRRLLESSAAGLGTALLFQSGLVEARGRGRLIRPPGALAEPAFLDRCIRCHECIRVCSTSGKLLQPASLEGGLEAFWTPLGLCRSGYCEYDCVMCTKVCPSGAIHELDVQTKKKTKIGLAFIDRSRCIPWYRNEGCLVCQEHCPTSPKAIVLRDEEAVTPEGKRVTVARPFIKEDLCIGCGICETRCPVAGESAVIVTPQNEERWEEPV